MAAQQAHLPVMTNNPTTLKNMAAKDREPVKL
jgi:hypothetical protein